MSKLTIAGIGPGEADYILPAVIEKMKKAHTVIAAKRVLPILEELCQDVSDSASVLQHDSISFFAMGKIKDTLEQIGKILSEGHDVVMAAIRLCTAFIAQSAMIRSARIGIWTLSLALVPYRCSVQHSEKQWKMH